ncbi:MAG: hypothetical protein HOP29_19730 [Phycisphaerales bacterium]|nr:hypothetical protein [Phycisphaerales bacterium]
MGFASGPVTFRRFFIDGPMATAAGDVVAAVKKCAFGRYGQRSADGVETGWISPEHLFDANIVAEKIVFDRFVHCQMRLDRTAAPSSLIRSYIRMEEAAAIDAGGKDRLTRDERHRAKEAAMARAEAEGKKGMHRRIAAYPVLIDLRQKTVYFGSLSPTALDAFILLFRDTFDCGVEPADAERIGFRIMDAAGDARSVEDAEPFHLVSPRMVEGDNGFDVNDRTFFGREFLTWLWYRTDVAEGLFEAGRDRVAAAIVKSMHLDCDFRVTGSDTIRADGPGGTPEARAALTTGKQPTRAGLILGGRSGEYALMFDGPRFTVSSLKLPDPSEGDRHDQLRERFEQVTEVAGLLDLLFGLFLGRRASSDWADELGRMKLWAAGGKAASGAARPAARKPRVNDRAVASADGESELHDSGLNNDGVILRLHEQTT